MPIIDDLLERRHFFSDRISTQVRFISIGLLAVTWGLLIGKVEFLNKPASVLSVDLIRVSGIAILALLFDFLQYICAYSNVNRLISEMEDKELKLADYKYDWLYKASNLFFWIKQILLVIGVIYFIICIFSLAYPG